MLFDSMTEEETAVSSNPSEPVSPAPTTTLGILALLGVVFLAQGVGAQLSSNSLVEFQIPDLVAFGAINRDLILVCGDWWRLAV